VCVLSDGSESTTTPSHLRGTFFNDAPARTSFDPMIHLTTHLRPLRSPRPRGKRAPRGSSRSGDSTQITAGFSSRSDPNRSLSPFSYFSFGNHAPPRPRSRRRRKKEKTRSSPFRRSSLRSIILLSCRVDEKIDVVDGHHRRPRHRRSRRRLVAGSTKEMWARQPYNDALERKSFFFHRVGSGRAHRTETPSARSAF